MGSDLRSRQRTARPGATSSPHWPPSTASCPSIRELFADGETPVGIYRKLAAGRPGTFLLESAEQGGIWSRFSFVGVASFGVLTQDGDDVRWLDYGLSAERALGTTVPTRPLDALAALHERWASPRIPGLPPLTGGLVGFIGWEAVRQFEHLPQRAAGGLRRARVRP